jgi:hypothetical protein
VFVNPDGDALAAGGLTVDGGIFLDRAQCAGHVNFLGADIGGDLRCVYAVFSNPDGVALDATRASVDGNVSLSKARCAGEVVLFVARIGIDLDCTQATFNNPNGDALNGDGLKVNVDAFLSEAQFKGQVRLPGAQIAGELACNDAVFSNEGGISVNLQQATVGHAAYMHPASLQGGLNLTRAQVDAWHDAKGTWPRQIELEGFSYNSIHASDATVKDRLRSWLPQTSYLPQPYEQLAAVYRQAGDESAATTLMIGEQRARRADHANRWIRWPSVVWSAVLRWTIGYGYRPAMAIIPLVVLVLLGSRLFLIASRSPDPLHPVLHSAKPGSAEQPSFNSFRYTIDLLLPVVNLKQRDSFVAEGWAAWASFGFTFAGWLLAAVVVAGLTGLFKRD